MGRFESVVYSSSNSAFCCCYCCYRYYYCCCYYYCSFGWASKSEKKNSVKSKRETVENM